MVETGMVMRVCDEAQPERLSVRSLRAKHKKSLALRMLWKLYVYETLLQGLAQNLQHMAAALRQLIQQEHPMVRPRPLAGHRHVAPADQADIRDRVVRGAKWAAGDHSGAVTGEAGDAMDVGGLEGFGQAHRRRDGGEPAGQPRLPRPGWAPMSRT
jgi:hypothetical protein